jgi:xanthine dehydrogenase YagT iron-sulfur-binding subunit
MDEDDSNTESNASNAFEVTRRTVIETGTTALLLTALPHAAVAAKPADGNEAP